MVERKTYRTAEDEKPKSERKPTVKKEEGKSEFINITGLFRSKSGKADTVFVTPEIAEKLSSIKAGDTLGVNENSKTGRLSLWYIVSDEAE